MAVSGVVLFISPSFACHSASYLACLPTILVLRPSRSPVATPSAFTLTTAWAMSQLPSTYVFSSTCVTTRTRYNIIALFLDPRKLLQRIRRERWRRRSHPVVRSTTILVRTLKLTCVLFPSALSLPAIRLSTRSRLNFRREPTGFTDTTLVSSNAPPFDEDSC